MKKVELLLPAGNEECLRAAVSNGADAVYFGLNKFNARESASNFTSSNIFSAAKYCHDRKVKVYIALNTLVKNSELEEYFDLMNSAYSAAADAVIIQDPSFIPIIKKNFPGMQVHLSTQATITNSASVPEGADRVILARELSLDEIKNISAAHNTEIFIHGALCFSYSGQCLFSSIAGGRSGNRGRCAQPCRKLYNNKYLLSTMDLCLLEKIPELIKSGVTAFKIEGRLRSPLYVATAAKIYRKYIDLYYNNQFSIDPKDIDELKLAFNREFTQGFAFTNSVVDSKKPMNRGLYIGNLKDNKLLLKKELKVGDGLGLWLGDKVIGHTVTKILKNSVSVSKAAAGDTVDIGAKQMEGSVPVYKTSSADSKINLGDELKPVALNIKERKIAFDFKIKENNDKPQIFVKVYNKKSALEADKAKSDIIYYDILKDDCAEIKPLIKNSKFFVFTPRILSDLQIKEITEKINKLKPDGVLVGNKGFLPFLKNYPLHLDYSFNCFNDIDLSSCPGVPIISPELNFNEAISLKNRNFIVLVHGDIVLMATKQAITAPELVDEEGRSFKVRNSHEILNYKQLGIFSSVKEYLKHGIKYFYIDISKDTGRFTRIYKKILTSEFDDTKIKKGYTKGHFDRGVL